MATTASEARNRLAGKTIWLWHYMHPDWQWEQSRAWHADRYAVAVMEALDIMQRDPDFLYYFDTESEFWEPVARQLGPRLEELLQRVREGRVRIVSAQVANCRPTQTGDETYLRNLQLGRAFFEANLPPTDISQFHSVDIAIGGSQMPQVLALAGFKYYRAWRPHGPMNVHGIPQQFYWEAPDGSRVLVTRGAYGGLYMQDPAFDNYAQDWDSAVSSVYDYFFHDQMVDDRSPSDQLWMIQGCDDSRPFRTHNDAYVDLPGFLEEWRKREDVPIHWCTPLEFSQAVEAHGDKLAVVKGVLDGCDCGYNAAFGGAQGMWRWRQMNDRRLLRAEWWTAAAATLGAPSRRDELQKLWRQHVTYQAHAQEACFREDLDYLVSLARDVQFHAERIQQEALTGLAQAAGGGDRTVRYLFNPHPWQVQADVEIYHACAVGGVESLELVDEHDTPLPQQRLGEFRHPRYAGFLNDQHRLVRVTLPPMGYRRVRFLEKTEVEPAAPAAPANGVVEAAGLRLSYRDNALREVADTSGAPYSNRNGSPWPNLYFHVLDNQSWPSAGPELRRDAYQPASGAWLQCGPLRWHHRSQGTLGPYKAQIDTLVGERDRELQVRVRLEGHWHDAPVTGFVTLLGDIDAGGQVTVDTPFTVEPRDPDHEFYVHNTPRDVEHLGITDMMERLRPGFFWGRSWADWSAGSKGLTWMSADGAYYWFKEPGQMGHVLLRCLLRTPGSWEEYTGEAWSGSGVHAFSYAIRFHDGDWRAADAQRRSAELRHPVEVARPNYTTEAKLDAGHSFLALSDNAQLSAYYAEDDGAVVRLYERDGRSGEATVTLDWQPAAAQVVDLLGKPLDTPAHVAGSQVRVTLRPWQIATLKLTRGTGA
ncbi:MAG: glycoside hydrolase family 38 N-terminal domain-containing protein [Anaerolineae bacterium]